MRQWDRLTVGQSDGPYGRNPGVWRFASTSGGKGEADGERPVNRVPTTDYCLFHHRGLRGHRENGLIRFQRTCGARTSKHESKPRRRRGGSGEGVATTSTHHASQPTTLRPAPGGTSGVGGKIQEPPTQNAYKDVVHINAADPQRPIISAVALLHLARWCCARDEPRAEGAEPWTGPTSVTQFPPACGPGGGAGSGTSRDVLEGSSSAHPSADSQHADADAGATLGRAGRRSATRSLRGPERTPSPIPRVISPRCWSLRRT